MSFAGVWSWRHGLVFWDFNCLVMRMDGKGGKGVVYERKVDLPQSGSPRRRIVTVGELSSMNNCSFNGYLHSFESPLLQGQDYIILFQTNRRPTLTLQPHWFFQSITCNSTS